MSRSKSRTSNTQNNREITTSLGDSRVTDTGSIGGNVQLGETTGNVNISTTDFGALDSAQTLSLGALDFGSDALEGGFGLAQGGFDLAESSLISSSDLAEQSINLSGGTFNNALAFAGSSNKSFSQETGKVVDKVLSFAQRSNTSENAQLLEGGLKLIAVLAGVAGAAYIFKKG